MVRLLAALLAWLTGVALTTAAGAPVQASPVQDGPMQAAAVQDGPVQDGPVQDGPVQAGSGKPEKFSHAQHVPGLWLTKTSAPETWRDCRGCHVFDAQNEVSAPQRVCNECHVGNGTLQRQFRAGWTDDLGGYRTRTRTAYRHHTHYMLECRECHLPYRRENLSDFDIVTGPGQCARCHEQRGEQEAIAMVKGLRWFRAVTGAGAGGDLGLAAYTPPAFGQEAAFAEKLTKAFAAPGEGINRTPPPIGGDFDHDDHAQIRCADCHATIPKASAKEVGTGQIAVAACAECHVDAGGKPLPGAPAPRSQLRTLRTLGTFTHADHYRGQGGEKVCPDAVYTRLADSKSGGCDACHVQEAAAVGLVQPDFPFKKGFGKFTYLDCRECHSLDGWGTGETIAKPLHDSSDGQIDGKHGWAACATCHVPGAGPMKTERPKVRVERFVSSTFRFTTHTHPDITSKGIELTKRDALADCTKCHRARVPELPSRLAERTFRHATHLPEQPIAQDCAGCHPSPATATTSAELANDFRTYTLAKCTECHWGGAVTEVVAGKPQAEDAKPQAGQVVQFPHAPHVKAAACTVCHERAADGGDMTTVPKALQCNLCHDHQAGGDGKPADPKAEGLLGGEATSCVRCHHQPAAPGAALVEAVPPPGAGAAGGDDARYRIETSVFAGFAQPQFHPLGGACTKCHKVDLAPDANFPGIKRQRVDHVFAVKPGMVHGGGVKDPPNCLSCHWTSRSVAGAVPAVDVKGQRVDEGLRARRGAPDSSETRERFGNLKARYPGQASDG